MHHWYILATPSALVFKNLNGSSSVKTKEHSRCLRSTSSEKASKRHGGVQKHTLISGKSCWSEFGAWYVMLVGLCVETVQI